METRILDLLRSLPKPPSPQNYMVHIDDLLATLRLVRAEGWQFQRGRDVFGKKNSTFLIYAKRPYYLATLFVDMTRTIDRGRFIIMPDVSNPLVSRRVVIEKPVDRMDWKWEIRFGRFLDDR